MLIQFEKLHGLGNDFIFINKNQFSNNSLTDKMYTYLGNRKLGVGCDLIVIYEQKNNDVYASFFNQDGSPAEICGNACRCMGLLLQMPRFTLHSRDKTYDISLKDNLISVNMGQPSFSLKNIGIENTSIDVYNLLHHLDLEKHETSFISDACALSLGNPHLVIFLNRKIDINLINVIGKKLENHVLFKNRINVSFAMINSPKEISLSVFERGVGLTMACGSGACATAFAAFTKGKTESQVIVNQSGGMLRICINEDNSITQEGTATYVFKGEIELCL